MARTPTAMKRNSRAQRRLPLLLSLPVVVLAGMSVWIWNIERQQASARLDAQAKGWASWVLQNVLNSPDMTATLQGLEVRVPRWIWDQAAQPPAAAAAARWEEARSLVLAGQREKAADVLAAAGSPAEQDVTAAGLPLAVMVARTRLELDPSPAPAEALALAAVRQPGPLSELLTADALPHLPENRRQSLLERARRSAALDSYLKSSAPSGGGVREDSIPGWRVNSKSADFVTLTSLEDARLEVQRRLSGPGSPVPSWAGVVVSYGGAPLISAPGRVLAGTAERTPWAVDISMADASAYQDESAKYSNFLMWVLANVVFVVTVAMWLIHRTFKKQARLAQLQSEFVASVSHELRTPVASIGVLAERLEGGGADPVQTAEYHRFIAREGRRLAALVDNVLDFSRIERGARAYDPEPADLPRLVRETVALMQPYAEEKGLTLTENIAEVPERLWPPVDAVGIRQALVNLVDNAIKFTPSGGVVTVEFGRAADDAVFLRVRDTGIGIPAAEHRRIFERFHRVDNGLRRETTGAGIGLSIVRHIVLAHGANVTVQSGPGKGALFEIKFPPCSGDDAASHAET